MAERKKKKTAKTWYALVTPKAFGRAKIAETPADDGEKVFGRIIEVSMQEFTGDFAKAHIKILFKVVDVSGFEARTAFIGHSTTSDYVKRMARRHKSKMDGVFDVTTKDNQRIRVKPSAYINKRIQTSQKIAIRTIMFTVIKKLAKNNTLDEFVKNMLDGEIGKQTYKMTKTIYPVKRVEVHKSELLEAPKIEIVKEDEEIEQIEEEPKEETGAEDTQEKKKKKKEDKKPEDKTKEALEEEITEEKEEKKKPEETIEADEKGKSSEEIVEKTKKVKGRKKVKKSE